MRLNVWTMLAGGFGAAGFVAGCQRGDGLVICICLGIITLAAGVQFPPREYEQVRAEVDRRLKLYK
jgi:hypothetical protein